MTLRTIITGFLLLCLGITAAAAAPTDEPTPEDVLFAQLKAAKTTKEAEKVEARLRRLWRKTGSVTIALLFEQGLTLMDEKDYANAAEKFDAIFKIEPARADAQALRAQALWRAGKVGLAISEIEAVLKKEPRHFAALRLFGETFESTGNYKAAIDMYTRALEIYPRYRGLKSKVAQLKRKQRTRR